MPYPKKPNHLKILQGSRRPLDPPSVDLPLLTETPAPPDWLPNSHALREWKRLAPMLVGAKLLTEPALATFGLLCAVFGTIVQTVSAGLPPTASLLAQYRALANDFGLTALGQQKLRLPAADDSTRNKFAALKETS